MKALLEHSAYFFGAIIVMSAVALSTYFSRFGIGDIANNLPPFALLMSGVLATASSPPALVMLALIAALLWVGTLKFALKVGPWKLPFSLLPVLAVPFVSFGLIAAGEQTGLQNYLRDLSPCSRLPSIVHVAFADDATCTDDGSSCLRERLGGACSLAELGLDCRVVRHSDSSIYLIDVSDGCLTPYAQRVSMGEVKHVALSVSERASNGGGACVPVCGANAS